MYSIPSAYTELILFSYGPVGGLINYYIITYEVIVYVMYTLSIRSANFCSRVDLTFAVVFGD
jgi:hypothetical protein